MCEPQMTPLWLSSGASTQASTIASAWCSRLRPTWPLDLARPLGWRPAAVAGGARRGGRHGEGAAGGDRGVAVKAADADPPVGLVVERRQVLIGERPVGGETMLDALAEVARPEARPDCGVDQGRAADA